MSLWGESAITRRPQNPRGLGPEAMQNGEAEGGRGRAEISKRCRGSRWHTGLLLKSRLPLEFSDKASGFLGKEASCEASDKASGFLCIEASDDAFFQGGTSRSEKEFLRGPTRRGPRNGRLSYGIADAPWACHWPSPLPCFVPRRAE